MGQLAPWGSKAKPVGQTRCQWVHFSVPRSDYLSEGRVFGPEVNLPVCRSRSMSVTCLWALISLFRVKTLGTWVKICYSWGQPICLQIKVSDALKSWFNLGTKNLYKVKLRDMSSGKISSLWIENSPSLCQALYLWVFFLTVVRWGGDPLMFNLIFIITVLIKWSSVRTKHCLSVRFLNTLGCVVSLPRPGHTECTCAPIQGTLSQSIQVEEY